MKCKGMMLALAMTGTAVPANAQWQFTKWGMSPEQVIGSSKGAAQRGTNELSAQRDQTKGAVGTFASGNYQFNVDYWFKANALSTVSLTPQDAKICPDLLRDLLAKYGNPIERSGGDVKRTMWVDQKSGNRVALVSLLPQFCVINYSPLVDASTSGL